MYIYTLSKWRGWQEDHETLVPENTREQTQTVVLQFNSNMKWNKKAGCHDTAEEHFLAEF